MSKQGSLLISVFLWLIATTASAEEFLVKYQQHFRSTQASLAKVVGLKVVSQYQAGQYYKVDINESKKTEALLSLYKLPEVAYVVPNAKVYAFRAPPSVETLKEQWHVAKVRAPEAWTRLGNRGSRQVTVAVIDTGVDYNHETLARNAVSGYDFRDNDSDPMDITSSKNPGHGTHCAGIIGATGLVDGGVIGISPEVSIMPLRFLGSDGSGDLDSAIRAIDYAIEKNVQIISASWGAKISASQAAPLVEAIKRADDRGIIFVAAAANDGANNDKVDMYPANSGLPNTITVAASGPQDEKPSWSNYGKAKVHVASPGLDIMSTLPSNKYGKLSGTSMATPLVAGLVALLKSADSSLTGAQARAILQTTGAKVSIETACQCRVDAFAAVDKLMKKDLVVVPAAVTLKANETAQFAGLNASGALRYAVSNASVANINNSGVLTALAKGETIVTITDGQGRTAQSLAVRVVDGSSSEPPAAGDCPIGDQSICDIMCSFDPTLPFCKQ